MLLIVRKTRLISPTSATPESRGGNKKEDIIDEKRGQTSHCGYFGFIFTTKQHVTSGVFADHS
jgi:hypothetical protein